MNIEVAGISLRVDCSREAQAYLAPFATNRRETCEIRVSPEEVQAAREELQRLLPAGIINFSTEECELFTLYHATTERLLMFDVLLLFGAAVETKNGVHLFVGESGDSMHRSVLCYLERLVAAGQTARLLPGERVLLRVTDKAIHWQPPQEDASSAPNAWGILFREKPQRQRRCFFQVYASPWEQEKAQWREALPLCAIHLADTKQGKTPPARQLEACAFRPHEPYLIRRTEYLLHLLRREVPILPDGPC